MKLGISNYGALVTKDFDMVGYVRALATEANADHTRVFNDLCIWDRIREGSFKFNPANAVFLYPYNPSTKKWDFSKINEAYVDRLHAVGVEARKHLNELGNPFEVIICGSVDPKYYSGSPVKGLFNQMGYLDSKELFHKGDFIASKWAMLKKYYLDLGKVISSLKMGRVFKTFEPFNEMPEWGSIVDELEGIKSEFRKSKFAPQLQLNPPSPYQEEVPDKWVQTLLKRYIKRLAFHGYFTPSEIKEDLKKLSDAGVRAGVVTFETDGSSPGFGLTRKTQQGHYKLRPSWQSHKTSVFKAHRQLIDTALDLGSAINLQDVGSAWDGDEKQWDRPDSRLFRLEMAKYTK